MSVAAEGMAPPSKSHSEMLGENQVGKSRSVGAHSGYLKIVGGAKAAHGSGLRNASDTESLSIYGNEIDDKIPNRSEEAFVADISKEELSALLRANKAEVDAVASAMKADMANWREQMRSDLKEVKSAVERQADKLEHNFSSQQIKLDAAIQIQTAKLEKTVSDTKIDIIRWVLGLPALAFTLWKIYEALAK